MEMIKEAIEHMWKDHRKSWSVQVLYL